MSLLFLEYPSCTTCKKAKKWLDDHQLEYTDRHIKDQNPGALELKEWHEKSGIPLKKFFNTSGMVYKEMKLKDRIPAMTEAEQLNLLASNGMLVKRPIVVKDDIILIGFKETEWEKHLLSNS